MIPSRPSATSEGGASGDPERGPERGFLPKLIDVYFSPGSAFAAITRQPGFWLPLVAYFVLSLACTAVWLNHLEPAQFVRSQLEQSGKLDSIPPERLAPALAMQARAFPYMAWTYAVFGAPLSIVVVAGVLLLIFRFVYAGEVRFVQALAVVSYSFLAMHLLSMPLSLLVMTLKDDWNVNQQEVLQANPTLFFDRATLARPLYAFLGSLDLFSFWTIALLAIGFAIASRHSVARSLWGVAVPWLLIVLFKVILVAL